MADTTAKVALITGANKGIGLETARQLGELGVTVLVGARDLKRGEDAAEVLRGVGVDARAIKLDVVNEADRAAAAKYVDKAFGRLDILVNNAAVMLDPRSGSWAANQTSTTPMAVLRDTFETNFFAVVALTQTLLPLLRKSPAGRIVNLSSILASLTLQATPGSPIYDAKTFAYDASKSALNAFTIHLAHELKGTRIKVNSAHPGWVKTDMGGEGAQMEIVDGAKTSVELAMLPDDGPTGGYFHMGEALPW
ncbi:MAG: SDR family oxidoreductase [Acidobacteriaceae bacterium]|jgi:NAD(P)-dependent dehydrogenase (short-subunit alcohol dehydrogenase family)